MGNEKQYTPEEVDDLVRRFCLLHCNGKRKEAWNLIKDIPMDLLKPSKVELHGTVGSDSGGEKISAWEPTIRWWPASDNFYSADE